MLEQVEHRCGHQFAPSFEIDFMHFVMKNFKVEKFLTDYFVWFFPLINTVCKGRRLVDPEIPLLGSHCLSSPSVRF